MIVASFAIGDLFLEKEGEIMKTEDLRKQYLTLKFIGGAMVASIFVYAGVTEMIRANNVPFTGFVKPLPPMEVLRPVLIAVSLIIFVLINVLRKSFRSGRLDAFLRASARGGNAALAPFMSFSIITFALAESICIFGFVLFLIAGSRVDFYIFFALSLVAYAVNFPRFADMEAWARKSGMLEEGGAGAGAGRRGTVFE